MVQSLTASRNMAPLLNQRISPERPCSAVLDCLSPSDLVLVVIIFSTACGTFFHDLIVDSADLKSALESEALSHGRSARAIGKFRPGPLIRQTLWLVKSLVS